MFNFWCFDNYNSMKCHNVILHYFTYVFVAPFEFVGAGILSTTASKFIYIAINLEAIIQFWRLINFVIIILDTYNYYYII